MSARTTSPTEIHVTTDSVGIMPPVAVCRLMNATYANSAMNSAQAPKAPSPASFAIFGGIESSWQRGEGESSPRATRCATTLLLEHSNDRAAIVDSRRHRLVHIAPVSAANNEYIIIDSAPLPSPPF